MPLLRLRDVNRPRSATLPETNRGRGHVQRLGASVPFLPPRRCQSSPPILRHNEQSLLVPSQPELHASETEPTPNSTASAPTSNDSIPLLGEHRAEKRKRISSLLTELPVSPREHRPPNRAKTTNDGGDAAPPVVSQNGHSPPATNLSQATAAQLTAPVPRPPSTASQTTGTNHEHSPSSPTSSSRSSTSGVELPDPGWGPVEAGYEISSPPVCLGEGGYGKVILAKPLPETHTKISREQICLPQKVAIKRVSRYPHGDWLEDVQREYEVLAALKSALPDRPNIVFLYDYVRTSDAAYFITDIVGNCTLDEYCSTQQGGFLSKLAELIQMATNVLSAMAFLHACRFFHGDLKGSNIMIKQNRKGELIAASVIDLGQAQRLDCDNKWYSGTPGYRPPEIVDGAKTFDEKADSWSVGCVFWEAMTGDWLYIDTEMYPHEEDRRVFDFDELTHIRCGGALPVMVGLLVVDPAQRKTITEVAQIKWV